MALPLYSQFPISSSSSSSTLPAPRKRLFPLQNLSFPLDSTSSNKHTTIRKTHFTTITKSTENDQNTSTTNPSEPEAEPETPSAQQSEKKTPEELGAEIKKATAEEREKKEPDLWSGVVEEIREIEWPAFNKVVGTTGVVLGVIAGSSVVLLTVNAVLSELSDRVFAGRGVQDFFG